MAIDTNKVIPYSCEFYDDVDGSGPYGGDIDLSTRADMGSYGVGPLTAVSSEPGDTTDVKLTARNQAGNVVTETKQLNGTTPVSFATAINRIVALEVISPLLGVFTFKDDTTSQTITEIDVNTFNEMRGTRMLFHGAYSSDVSVITRYEKTFWYNYNAGGILISPVYRITADPGAIIEQGIALSKNDTATIVDRNTAPAGITFVDDNVDQNGDDLSNGDGQGIWWKQTAAISNPPQNQSFTSQISFQSI